MKRKHSVLLSYYSMMKKKQILFCIIICLSLLYCFSGCAINNKLYPLPEQGVKVTGEKIYINNMPFAELKYYFSAGLSKHAGEAYMFASSVQHRGLAIYYYDNNKLVWIFPKRGLETDIKKGHYSARGDSDGYFGWVYDVKISQDGKYVYYKTPGMFYNSSHKYLVEYGISQ
ncbi:MAG TPA: hypothetical protein VMU29_10400 [Smithella sp.]|nr:hypothetical protein [Smithella sp.]